MYDTVAPQNVIIITIICGIFPIICHDGHNRQNGRCGYNGQVSFFDARGANSKIFATVTVIYSLF